MSFPAVLRVRFDLAGRSFGSLPRSRKPCVPASLSDKQAGIVRSRTRFGIRVPESAYEELFKALKPGLEPRPRVKVQLLYRLSPIPAGADEQAIHKWSVLQQWPVKVTKALSPGEWLIGAAGPPLEGWLTFNNSTVLIVLVVQRSRERQVIQAGTFAASTRGSLATL